MLKYIQRKKRSIYVSKDKVGGYDDCFYYVYKRLKKFAEKTQKKFVDSMLKGISHSSLTHSQEREYYSEIDKEKQNY